MIPEDWIDVESSKISRVKFIPSGRDDMGTLLVEFNEGRIYSYQDVPSAKVERLLHGNSAGEYFHWNIRSEHETERIK